MIIRDRIAGKSSLIEAVTGVSLMLISEGECKPQLAYR